MQQEDDGLAAAQMELASLRAVMQIFGLKMAPSHTVLVYIFGSPVLSSCSEQAFINKQLQLLFSTMTSFSNAAKLRPILAEKRRDFLLTCATSDQKFTFATKSKHDSFKPKKVVLNHQQL